MGLEQANTVRQAILSGQKDDLVEQQLQTPQSRAIQQVPIQQALVQQAQIQPTPAHQNPIRQTSGQGSIVQQQVSLLTPVNLYAQSPVAAPHQAHFGQQLLQHTTTTAMDSMKSSMAGLQLQRQPAPPVVQQAAQNQAQLQYQQQTQSPPPAQQLQYQQPLQITAGPSQSPAISAQQHGQGYFHQHQVASNAPPGQQLPNSSPLQLTATPNPAMQQNHQVQQQAHATPPTLSRGYIYPQIGLQPVQQALGAQGYPHSQTPQPQQQLPMQGLQQANLQMYQQPNALAQQQQPASSQPQLPAEYQQTLAPSRDLIVQAKKGRKRKKHSHRH